MQDKDPHSKYAIKYNDKKSYLNKPCDQYIKFVPTAPSVYE